MKLINSKKKSTFNITKAFNRLLLLSILLLTLHQLYQHELPEEREAYCSKSKYDYCGQNETKPHSYDQDDTTRRVTRSSTRNLANLNSGISGQQQSKQGNSTDDGTGKLPNVNTKVGTATKDKKKEDEKVSCRNENGEAVEWFLNVKLPSGLEYISFSSADKGDSMHHYVDISENSALRKTLDQFYGHENEFFSLMYNDHPPEKAQKGSKYAHAKGVVHCKDKNCYFIQHSWPNFPPSSTHFLTGSDKFAQHFFCVSLDFGQAESIFRILYHIHPVFYGPPLTNAYGSVWLQKIIAKDFLMTKVMEDQQIFFSGGHISSYFKNKESNDVIWNGLAALHKNVPFDITSWLSGSAKPIFHQKQKPYFTAVSKTLAAHGNKEAKSWDFGLDHSKMAISRKHDVHVLCFGDLNFVTTKTMRAGAIYCYENSMLYEAYTNVLSIDTFEEAAEAIQQSRPLFKKKNYSYYY